MHATNGEHIPVLKFHALTKYFDYFWKYLMPEDELRNGLIARSRIEPGHRVLDMCCGTGTLLVRAKKAHPEARVQGIDLDTKVLGMARQNIAQAGLDIPVEQGDSTRLPYEDGTFDRVMSSMAWHHLNLDQKLMAFREAYRVLKPGGEMHILDFGTPDGALAYAISLVVRFTEEVMSNVQGHMPRLMKEAGFADLREEYRGMTMFGTVYIWGGVKRQANGA